MSPSPAPTKSFPQKAKNGRARAVRDRPKKRSLIRWNGKSLTISISIPWPGVYFEWCIWPYALPEACSDDMLIRSYRDLRSAYSPGRTACDEQERDEDPLG